MTNKAERKVIKDYLVDRLSFNAVSVTPYEQSIAGNDVDFITTLDQNTSKAGLVILVDRIFTGNSLREIRRQFRNYLWDNIAFAFYKDGKTFFRAGVKFDNYSRGKSKYGLSLKNYNDKEINHMINFRPEEQLAYEQGKGWVQYYQPASQNLTEGIVNLKFEPVRFDYSHINANVKFKPENKDSEKLRIWKERKEKSGKLKIEMGFLLSR